MLRMRGEWHGLHYGTHGSYQFHAARSTFQLNVNGNAFLQSTGSITFTTHPCKAGKRTVSSDNPVYQMKAILVIVVFIELHLEGELQ